MKTIIIDNIEYELVPTKKEAVKPTAKERLIGIIQSVNRPFLIDPERPDEINFFRDNSFMFKIQKSHLWCSYKNVWVIFEREYSMEHYKTQALIKYVLEKTFGINGLIPFVSSSNNDMKLEEDFKVK